MRLRPQSIKSADALRSMTGGGYIASIDEHGNTVIVPLAEITGIWWDEAATIPPEAFENVSGTRGGNVGERAEWLPIKPKA